MSNSSTLVSSLSRSTPTPSMKVRSSPLAPLLGPLLIGGLVANALWGLICVQTFTYFMERPRDRVAFRVTIAGLWLLDTFSSIALFHLLYYYIVINFMNPPAIETIVWSDAVYMFTVALSNFVIRALFMYKIYQLSKKIWIIIPLFVLSLLVLGSGIRAFVECFNIKSILDVKEFSTMLYLYIASEAASDVSVAATLSVVLYRGRTGLHKTDGVVRTLMVYVIYTGLLAAFISVLGMILFATVPHNDISQAVTTCLGKLYLSAYLAMLNARQGLREQMSLSETIHPSRLRDLATVPGKSREGPDNLAISVRTLMDRTVEDGPGMPSATMRGPGRVF
ncbi:hypothetical protein APHAL10511_005206 [Amanita phalloides]|nr:hypothetical protein APHAL10511_005206 [Amanita phalloides]